MKHKLLSAALLLAALAATPALAQESPGQDSEQIYTYLEQMPAYEGGTGAMMQFINAQITYSNAQPEGMVVLRFVIDQEGGIDAVEVVKGLTPALDAACVNAVKAMGGHWKPGMKDGKPVPVRFTLPVKFGQPRPDGSAPETMPEYKGGVAAFKAFMKQHARYPRKGTKYGTVVVSFVINEDGSLSDYQVRSGVEPALDQEALRLAKLTDGQWLPAVKDGKRVKVQYNMPVFF